VQSSREGLFKRAAPPEKGAKGASRRSGHSPSGPPCPLSRRGLAACPIQLGTENSKLQQQTAAANCGCNCCCIVSYEHPKRQNSCEVWDTRRHSLLLSFVSSKQEWAEAILAAVSHVAPSLGVMPQAARHTRPTLAPNGGLGCREEREVRSLWVMFPYV
jgi:hypothetical protein